MGDFYLDVRPASERQESPERAAANMRWCPETAIYSFVTESYALIISRTDKADLWSPAVRTGESRKMVVALAGRVALEPHQWDLGKASSSEGGLACRAITEMYIRGGVSSLTTLSGNFSLIVIDDAADTCHLITDQAGLQMAYAGQSKTDSGALCSHPDVLASILNESQAFDFESLAEFIASGQLSFPHTYYRGIKALAWGTIFSFIRQRRQWHPQPPQRYFQLEPAFLPDASLSDLSDQFAAAFQQAVRVRSLPLFGNIALAMSGGMDSRAVLSCIEHPERVRGFVLVDEENLESSAARAVATACGTHFSVIRRPFDYYGSNAAEGARISGAMGGLASNHFLGIRPWLNESGISNVLTGCYCDYLFKALALNTKERPLSRREVLSSVRAEFYRPIFHERTRYESAIADRLEARLPVNIESSDLSDETLFNIECRRTFPLAYEGDCSQRVIGQRIFPWFTPMADRGLLEIYRRIPSRLKLNGTLFIEMLRRVCSPAVLAVPNSNTGAAITAGQWDRAFHRYKSAFLTRLHRHHQRGLAGRGSWPNWEYYIQNSSLVAEQWDKLSPTTREILHKVLGDEMLNQPIQAFRGPQVELFQRIWTLKLWLEHRVGVPLP
jgi:hypothetical protein